MKHRSALKSSKTSVVQALDPNVKNGVGRFTFSNGDAYEGGYAFNSEQRTLIKQGHGKYSTDNFDTYVGGWENDQFADAEIHIRYNNGAEYTGGVDANGTMKGQGVYKFPDGSSIRTTWHENKPSLNVAYRDSYGFTWSTDHATENTIAFSPGNHFWDELCETNEEN